MTVCDSCGEPSVPLIQCADCERRICELCAFGDEFVVCLPCNRRRNRAEDHHAPR